MAEEQQENVVYVGKKPPMAYVLAVLTQLNAGNQEVHVKARGRAISRAVDVVEIVRRRFGQNIVVKSIDIGTEEREVEGKGKVNVSVIDIVLQRQ